MKDSLFNRPLDFAVVAVGCTMVTYHMAATQFIVINDLLHQNFHLAFSLALVFLSALRKGRSSWSSLITLALLIVGLLVASYIFIFFEPMTIMTGLPDRPTFIVGICLIIVVVLACWYAWGPILPILAGVGVIYFLFGQLLPDPFFHRAFPIPFVISMLGVGFQGIFGWLLDASANMVFLFVIFGGILQTTKAHIFFLEIGRVAAKWLDGGPAQTAVFGSALVGTVSGAALANVTLTGAFTIPLMKRVGYRHDTAGAVEAVAIQWRPDNATRHGYCSVPHGHIPGHFIYTSSACGDCASSAVFLGRINRSSDYRQKRTHPSFSGKAKHQNALVSRTNVYYPNDHDYCAAVLAVLSFVRRLLDHYNNAATDFYEQKYQNFADSLIKGIL